MTVSPVASTSKIQTALTNLGIPDGFIAYDTVPLLQQLVVALGNVTGGGGGGSTAWGAITGTLSNQTDLQTALNARLVAASNLSDLTNATTARANLGLGTMATQDSDAVAITGGDLLGLNNVQTEFLAINSVGVNATLGFTGVNSPAYFFRDLAVGGTLISDGDTGTVTNNMLAGSISLTTKVTGILPSANGGTGVNNAGTITNASNTTITGGGTLALGGFTLTVPATGTAALLATANAFTAAQTITAPVGATALTLAGGTQTASFPLISGTQTWNNAGVTFVGELQNYTSTASAAASRFLEYQLAGVAKFAIRKDGAIGVGGLPMGSGIFSISNASAVTVITQDTGYIQYNIGADILTMQGDCRFASGIPISWTNAGSVAGTEDLFIGRKAAATLRLGIDAAGVTDQMLTAASRITSDGVGANLTIAPGNGRGGAGGTLILSTYDTGAAATIGTLRSRMTFDTAGAVAFPVVTAVTTETVVSDTTWPVTINGVAYKVCLKA